MVLECIPHRTHIPSISGWLYILFYRGKPLNDLSITGRSGLAKRPKKSECHPNVPLRRSHSLELEGPITRAGRAST